MSTTHVEHAVTVAAPASAVAAIITDVTSWPLHFPPTVHAERLDGATGADGHREERIRIWAMANGLLRTWTSRRRLSADGRRIDFEQVQSQHPVAAMSGSWRVEDDEGGCRVRLLHAYAAVDDDPAALALIGTAVDTNSRSELAALRSSAERLAGDDGLLLSFEDTEVMDGTVADAYAFVRDAALWPQRLPHVVRLDLTESPGGLQVMEMDTRSPDGSVHTTRSGRVCLDDRIVYKQTTPPAALVAHTGRWTFEQQDGGHVAVTSHHSVIIDPDALPTLPVELRELPRARDAVRHALGSNSRATLAAAGAHLRSAASSAV